MKWETLSCLYEQLIKYDIWRKVPDFTIHVRGKFMTSAFLVLWYLQRRMQLDIMVKSLLLY